MRPPQSSRGTSVVLTTASCALLLLGSFVGPVATARSVAPSCFGRSPNIIGTEGSDQIVGTSGRDVIVGLGGDDTITGLGGGDLLCGGDGADTIKGGGGKDRIAGDAGDDLLLGGNGADRILGASGNDTLRGQGGDDLLDGGLGADRTDGGAETDSCANGEVRSSCEVVPPSGCTNPPLVPADAVVGGVEITGTNAFQSTGAFLIDGEIRRLTFGGELRNASKDWIRPGRLTIAIYDALGTRIGTRFVGGEASALGPGERTVFVETMPSWPFYSSGETNSFPDGWASWELIANAVVEEPVSYSDVVIGSRLLSLVAGSDGVFEARGVAINTRDEPIDSVTFWLVLYDQRGRFLSALSDWELLYPDVQAPGAELPFTLRFSLSGPKCFRTVDWGAAGH